MAQHANRPASTYLLALGGEADSEPNLAAPTAVPDMRGARGVFGTVEVLAGAAEPTRPSGLTWDEELLRLCQMESAPVSLAAAVPGNRTMAEVAAALFWADQWVGNAEAARERAHVTVEVWDEARRCWLCVAERVERGPRRNVIAS